MRPDAWSRSIEAERIRAYCTYEYLEEKRRISATTHSMYARIMIIGSTYFVWRIIYI